MEEKQNDTMLSEANELTDTIEAVEAIETIAQAEHAVYSLKLRSFKSVCGKVGFAMCVFFICRIISDAVQVMAATVLPDSTVIRYSVFTAISVVFVYFVPLAFAMIVFDTKRVYGGKLGVLYKRPEKIAKVMGNFPAVYGLGQTVNLLTLIVVFILSLFSATAKDIAESYKGMSTSLPPNFVCACVFAFVAVIIAPIVEEFWVRGIFLDALKPFGNGFAIIITSVIFGAMHSNIRSFFFTTALGLAFGYITYATGSIFTSTVMHAIFNAISGILVMFMTVVDVKPLADGSVPPQNEFLTVMYYIYVFIVYAAVVVGIISFFKKIKVIRRYKIEKSWAGAGFGKRLVIFLSSIATISWVLLAVNAHMGNPLLIEIMRFLNNAAS